MMKFMDRLELKGNRKAGLRGNKVAYTFLMMPDHLEQLKDLSDLDGVTVSHQIRQAIRIYLYLRKAFYGCTSAFFDL